MVSPQAPCDAGYYCPPGQAVSTPPDFICTTGHYCPRGSASQIACPSGEYQDESGQVEIWNSYSDASVSFSH